MAQRCSAVECGTTRGDRVEFQCSVLNLMPPPHPPLPTMPPRVISDSSDEDDLEVVAPPRTALLDNLHNTHFFVMPTIEISERSLATLAGS